MCTAQQASTAKKIWLILVQKFHYSFVFQFTYLMTAGLLFDIAIQIRYYDDLDKNYINVFGVLVATATVLYLGLFYYYLVFRNIREYGSNIHEKNKLIRDQLSLLFEINAVNKNHFGRFYPFYHLLKKVSQISIIVFLAELPLFQIFYIMTIELIFTWFVLYHNPRDFLVSKWIIIFEQALLVVVQICMMDIINKDFQLNQANEESVIQSIQKKIMTTGHSLYYMILVCVYLSILGLAVEFYYSLNQFALKFKQKVWINDNFTKLKDEVIQKNLLFNAENDNKQFLFIMQDSQLDMLTQLKQNQEAIRVLLKQQFQVECPRALSDTFLCSSLPGNSAFSLNGVSA